MLQARNDYTVSQLLETVQWNQVLQLLSYDHLRQFDLKNVPNRTHSLQLLQTQCTVVSAILSYTDGLLEYFTTEKLCNSVKDFLSATANRKPEFKNLQTICYQCQHIYKL